MRSNFRGDSVVKWIKLNDFTHHVFAKGSEAILTHTTQK